MTTVPAVLVVFADVIGGILISSEGTKTIASTSVMVIVVVSFVLLAVLVIMSFTAMNSVVVMLV